MVTNITSLSRTGLRDWLVQRVSAVVLAVYTVFIVGWLLYTETLSFELWHALFEQTWMRIFSLMALVSLVSHAWIGMWTIFGDYLNERALGKKALTVRFLSQALCGIVLFVYIAWGVQILWGL